MSAVATAVRPETRAEPEIFAEPATPKAKRIELNGPSLIAVLLAVGILVLLSCAAVRSVWIKRIDNDVDRELNAAAQDFRVAIESANLDKPGAPPLTQVVDGFVNSRKQRGDLSYFGIIDGKPHILRGGPAAGVERLGDVAGWAGLLESRNGAIETRSGTARWLAVPVTGNGKTLGTFVVLEFVSGRYTEVDDAIRIASLIAGLVLGGAALAAWASTRRSLRRIRPETHSFDPLAELARLFDRSPEDRPFQPSPPTDQHTHHAGDTAMHQSDVTSGRLRSGPADAGRGRGVPGLELTPVDLGQLTDDILSEAMARASREFVVERRARLEIVADQDLLTEAVMNLIDHAVASTTTGDTIAVGTSSPDDVVQLWVRHSGAGIPADVQAEMFRADEDDNATGMRRSLAIARAHNGTMAVASRDDATTFMIVLPFDPAHAPTKPIRDGLNKRIPAAARERTVIDIRDAEADDVRIELSDELSDTSV